MERQKRPTKRGDRKMANEKTGRMAEIALADTRGGLRRLSTLLAATDKFLTGEANDTLIAGAVLREARHEVACLLNESAV